METRVSPRPKLVPPVPAQFARFQLCADLLESVCLRCCSVLGTASHPTGLLILEQGHRCSHISKKSATARPAA